MSVLIWMGTFLVFAAISVTLAITTSAMYFLFITTGLVMSTFAMACYKPEGPWEPLMPYSRLCEPRLETHAPVYSITRSDPWLWTSAKTTLRGSFSSPRQHAQVDDTWHVAAAPPRNTTPRLPSGLLPLASVAVVRCQSTTTLDSPNQCHRVPGTALEEFHRASDSIETIEWIERSEVVTMKTAADPSPEPPLVTIQTDGPIFSPSDDKTVVKEFPVNESEDSESKAGLLDEEGIADSAELSKVVANVERNIHEAASPYGNLHKPRADDAAAASRRKSSHERKTAQKSTSKDEPALGARRGNAPELDSGAAASGLPSFWKEQTSPLPDDPSPGSSSPMMSACARATHRLR
ncbi:hypothetical protein HPB52_005484 [Rhipicephalus sanguineus]|uniref:Uncharacterized protein n=1 Tax=Rhipicephalus sanguineus TaxID=34632 RepID=A0A9D4PZJ6_RHISA|nr:hypothetical protein HPB52_005484 [Rhipicephalus sanguineus]